MTKMQGVYLHLIFFILYLNTISGSWVDPYSMDSNIKSKVKPTYPQKPPDLNTEYCSNIMSCESDLYLRRIVRLILSNAYLDTEDLVGYITGHVNLKLSTKEYEFLLNFSQNDDHKEEIYSEVSSIFEVALQKTSFVKYKEMIMSYEEILYFLIFNPTTCALVCASLVLYIIYKLLRANYTWKSIIKYLFLLMYVMDFVITYLHIMKEEEIKNMVAIKQLGLTPPECDPQKLSWWPYMKTQFESIFFEHPCKVYYETTHQNYRYLVAPTRILTRQFRTILIEPVGDLGEAFGKFGRQMFTSLPWGLNIAIFPIMLIAVCIIIFIILLFITKPRLRISLFHLFTIEIGQAVRFEPVNAIQEVARREVGYNTQHRALIEDASNDNYSSNEDANIPNFSELMHGEHEDEPSTQKAISSGSDKNISFIDNIGNTSNSEA